MEKKDGTIYKQNSWHNDCYLFNGPNSIERQMQTTFGTFGRGP